MKQVVRDMETRGKEFGQPPNSPKHEAHVIASVIIDKDTYDEVRDLVPEDFYIAENRALWTAIQMMDAKGKKFNALSLPYAIKSLELDSEFEGEVDAYITTLVDENIFISDIAGSAATVQSMARCRIIVQGAYKLLTTAYGGDDENAQTQLNELVFDVQKRNGTKNLEPVNTLIDPFMKRMEYMTTHQNELNGVPTGLTDLDRLLGGLKNSDLDIIAARPSVGKSSLAMTIAQNAAGKYGKTIAFFSLEMSKEQLFNRLISMLSGIDQERIASATLEDDEWVRMTEALDAVSSMPIYIDDTGGVTPAYVKSKLRNLMATGVTPDLVIVDYLQYMCATDIGKKSENRVLEVGRISADLKKIAKDLNLPVLALAQLSRSVESRNSKVPMLSDLRESGSIENDADVVMFIYRDDVYNPESERPNTADIIVAKHRNGKVGEVSTFFKKSTTQFVDLEIHHTDDDEVDLQFEQVEADFDDVYVEEDV